MTPRIIPTSIPTGMWGQRRRRYLREHRKALYNALLFSGKLDSLLADIDQQANNMFSQIVKQLAEQEGITEQLKADNQMEWVRQMNSVRSRADEIIYSKLIYR